MFACVLHVFSLIIKFHLFEFFEKSNTVLFAKWLILGEKVQSL